MTTRVYVQSEHFSDIKFVEVAEESSIAELLHAVAALMPSGTKASDLKLSVEDDEDEVACREATHVKHLRRHHGVRVHVHRCERIKVHVRFGSEVVEHLFLPASTIGRVRQWAGHKLSMAPDDIAEHVLQIAGTAEQPDIDTHVGSLAKCPECSVSFDLVPAHRING